MCHHIRQLRIQRFRWGIGSRLVLPAFDPFNRDIGGPGPRFWLWMPASSAGHLLGPAHLFLWLMSLEYSIIAPDARHTLGKWFAFLLMTRALTLVPKFLVLTYYRRLRLLPWAVLWVPFKQLKRFFLLEALLASQTRPVKPPLPMRAPLSDLEVDAVSWRPPATRRPAPDHRSSGFGGRDGRNQRAESVPGAA